MTAKAFAHSNGMKWVQAYVGMNWTAIGDLGYPDDPIHLLIGADGKLISNVTKVEDLKQELEKAVGSGAR